MSVSHFMMMMTTIFMVVVLPIMVVMHYVTKWKATRGLSQEEQSLLEDLWKSSQSMDSRLNTLETILDDQEPNWKKKT